MLVVIIQADGVIVIFYDVLALQFIQKLDDIGFSVSKIEVLGKRLQRATMTPYFHMNFQREKGNLGLKRMRMFLKAIYFINFGKYKCKTVRLAFLHYSHSQWFHVLALFFAAMMVVSVRQISGYYQCESINVTCKSSALFSIQIYNALSHCSVSPYIIPQSEMRSGKIQLCSGL